MSDATTDPEVMAADILQHCTLIEVQQQHIKGAKDPALLLALENESRRIALRFQGEQEGWKYGHLTLLEIRKIIVLASRRRGALSTLELRRHQRHEQAVYSPTPNNQRHLIKGENDHGKEEAARSGQRHGGRESRRIIE